jgi:hypothetical protein
MPRRGTSPPRARIGLSEIPVSDELRQMNHHKGFQRPPDIALRNTKDPIEHLSYNIVGAALEVHKQLGPGLLEWAYEACLCRELALRESTTNSR